LLYLLRNLPPNIYSIWYWANANIYTCVSETRMAAPKTTLLTGVDPTIPRDYPIHVFTTSLGGQFDTSQCITSVPFIIHPSEDHMLITDLDQIFGPAILLQTLNDQRVSLSVTGTERSFRLCYVIRLKSPDMMLHVGQDTSLSLLLRAGCLLVTPILATKDQTTPMIRPPPSAAAADQPDIKPVKRPKME
jgi:hypothetical protein